MRITVYLGSKCNLNCKYCHKEAETVEPVVSDELLDRLSSMDDVTVKFMGGEPTLYMDTIKKFVDRLPNARFAITTNGVLLDDYIDYFRKNKFFICLSYDGAGDKIRDFDPFTKLINYPWLHVSCVLYHGNTDLKKIYDDFAEKEDVVGRNLIFYPHIMHVTNSTNSAYKLTKDDYDSIIEQTQAIMIEFLQHYLMTGRVLKKYYPYFVHLAERKLNDYEYGETFCVNKKVLKLDVAGNSYSCQYIRDEMLTEELMDMQKLLDEKFPNCKSCAVYGMCGAACVKSIEHHLECYYYKKLFSWFMEWYETNKSILDKIPLPKPYSETPHRFKFEDLYVFDDIRYMVGFENYTVELQNDIIKTSFRYDGVGYAANVILANIPDGESSSVFFSKENKKIKIVYGCKKFFQKLDLTPEEYSGKYKMPCILQVNSLSGGRYLVKCYPSPLQENIDITFEGKPVGYRKTSINNMLEIERRYTFSVFPHELEIKDGMITTLWRVMISPEYPKRLYLNYNGQSKRIREGLARITFPYKEGEKFYWGDEGTKYKGRSFSIEQEV